MGQREDAAGDWEGDLQRAAAGQLGRGQSGASRGPNGGGWSGGGLVIVVAAIVVGVAAGI